MSRRGETPTPTPTPADSFEISIGNPTSRQMQADDTITFTNGFVASDFVDHLGFTIDGLQLKLKLYSGSGAYFFQDADGIHTYGVFNAVQSEEPITELKYVSEGTDAIPSGTTFEFYS